MKSTKEKRQYAYFLKELKQARLDAGMSQEQLALALGQLQTFISKCESGARRLDIIEARSWVLALGLDFHGFLDTVERRIDRNRPLEDGRQLR